MPQLSPSPPPPAPVFRIRNTRPPPAPPLAPALARHVVSVVRPFSSHRVPADLVLYAVGHSVVVMSCVRATRPRQPCALHMSSAGDFRVCDFLSCPVLSSVASVVVVVVVVVVFVS